MIEHSTDLTELAKALTAAQGQMRAVAKDSANPHFKNRYASLEAVIDVAKPALTSNGLAFSQAPGAIIEGAVEITTMLMHTSGQWMRSTLHMPLAKKDPQGVGSAITYGLRYSLMAVLGVPPSDDDDAEKATDRTPPAKAVSKAVQTQEQDNGPTEDEISQYITDCRTKIWRSGMTEAQLRDWWKKQGDNRKKYRLTQDDTDALLEDVKGAIAAIVKAA